MFLLFGFAFGSFGALVNYVYFKKQKDQDLTLQGCVKAVILGGATGLVIWLWNDGGTDMAHMAFAGIAFWAGLGSETFIGKLIGTVAKSEVPEPETTPTLPPGAAEGTKEVEMPPKP